MGDTYSGASKLPHYADRYMTTASIVQYCIVHEVWTGFLKKRLENNHVIAFNPPTEARKTAPLIIDFLILSGAFVLHAS